MSYKSLDEIIETIHSQSGAKQSAIYYSDYPKFDSLIRNVTHGDDDQTERYWKSHFLEAHTIQELIITGKPLTVTYQDTEKRQENMVCVPIRSGENNIGVMVHIYSDDTPPPLDQLTQNVEQYSRELFNGWVEFLVAEQTKPLSFLFHMASTISSSLDLDRVLLSVVEQATLLFRAKMSSLMLIDKGKRELEMVTAYGCSLEYLDKPNLPIEGSIMGTVVSNNKMLSVEDIFAEPMYLHKDHASREGVASLLSAPISFHQEVFGVLNIYSPHKRRWQRSEKDLLQTFANHAAIAINNVRVHEQVVSMEDQLHVSAKLATMGELAAGLAHEIRNPLAVINMLIHSWVPGQLDEKEFERDREVIAHKVSNLNTLVSDLLNLAKSRTLDRKPYDIRELIHRVLRLLRHRIHQQKVNIKEIYTDNKFMAVVDRERLEQAVLNIILNALDVTPKGGTITIQVRKNSKEQIAIDISDTGSGIDEDQIPHLFKAFHTTKRHGIGLGLPMTRRIVEEHKGEIFVSCNSPDGATFTMLIPIDSE